MQKIAIKTIGCKLNQYDSQSIAEPFLDNGYKWVKFDNTADIYVINTCTVTGRADYSSRQAISRAVREVKSANNQDAVVVVTGCYAEVDKTVLENIDGVNVVAGNRDKLRIYDIVQEYLGKNGEHDTRKSNHEWGRAITGMHGYSRAFIKIQDGCNSNCSYCIVPRARGREVSRPPDEIFSEIERLEKAGYHEVVLTGVHIGRYQYKDIKFHDLLNKLLSGDGPRVRFSSIEPNEVTDQLIDTISGKQRFCRHIHLPVQSGSDTILRAMKRGYNSEKVRSVVSHLKDAVPGITLGADFIIGFPGETDEDFRLSMDIAKSCGFGYLHVFSYSDRPGTESSKMDSKVDSQVKSERSQRLRDLSARLLESNLSGNINNVEEAILESRKHRETGFNTGITDNYLRVVFSENSVKPGNIVNVKCKSVQGTGKRQYLLGELVRDRKP